jgi:hypothetical protein
VNRSYISAICRSGLVGTVGQTVPINHLEPYLQKLYIVVIFHFFSKTWILSTALFSLES